MKAANALEAMATNNYKCQKAFLELDAPKVLIKLLKVSFILYFWKQVALSIPVCNISQAKAVKFCFGLVWHLYFKALSVIFKYLPPYRKPLVPNVVYIPVIAFSHMMSHDSK